MTDEKDNIESSNDDEQAEGPVCGERLAQARREQQIAVLEIAKELHLDEPKVRALERNEFEVLGAPVFAKGHLRKYAQLVGVSEADVLDDYYVLNRATASPPPVVSVRPRPRQEMSPVPWLVAIVIIIIAAAAYWWFAMRVPPATVTEPEAEEPAAAVEAYEPAEEQAAVELPQEEVDSTAAETEPEVIEPAAAEPEPEPAPGQMRLSVTYNGDCWTEITDAGGRRLFFDLGRAGRTVNLSGDAPFNVLFGDADNVSLEVNGEPYVIPAANRRGQTARLTIAGP